MEIINLIGIAIIILLLIVIYLIIKPTKSRISKNDIAQNWKSNGHKGPQSFTEKYS